MINKIDFEDKVAVRVNTLPRKNKVTALDLTELKNAVNEAFSFATWTLDMMETANGYFVCPHKCSINEVSVLVSEGSETVVSLFVNGSTYTLGDQILSGSVIDFEATDLCTVNLKIEFYE